MGALAFGAMRMVYRKISRAAAVLLAATAAMVPATPASATITTTKTEIQYIISPHPDDVFEGWSLVQDSTANYPVFITLTEGESTGWCINPELAYPALGVAYWGTFNTGTQSGCVAARMGSLNNWLDDQSVTDPDLAGDVVKGQGAGDTMTRYDTTAPLGGIDTTGAPTVAGMGGCRPEWTSGCTGTNPNKNKQIPDNLNIAGQLGVTEAQKVVWYVGKNSARVQFNLGDGNLTDAEVVWAFKYVHDNRATYLPLTNQYGVVAAAYSNLADQYSACGDYSHHDHRAVQEAVYNTKLINDPGRHPQWGNTCGSQTTTTGVDPDSLPANGGRQNEITTTHYNQNMSQDGNFQVRFRWLKGGGTNVWPSGLEPTGSIIFAQWNYFWTRFNTTT